MSGAFKLKDYLSCMLEVPELSGRDLERAVQARNLGDAWAFRLLEERFLPSVVRWVQPYRGHGIAFHKLIETGNRALLRGLRSITPAVPDISDHLERCVVEEVEALVFVKK